MRTKCSSRHYARSGQKPTPERQGFSRSGPYHRRTCMSHPVRPGTGPAIEKDFLPINGTDYIEFYVGNAKQSSYYYRSAWGFRLVAYAGLETGVRDRSSYVLE